LIHIFKDLLYSINLETIDIILYIVSTHTTKVKWEAAPSGKMAHGYITCS
jgi:hypothetical protein